MFEWFFISSLLLGIMLILSLCPLGSVMLWRKIPYIGDSIAHASVLGIVLALFFDFNMDISLLITAIVFVAIIVYLRNEKISGTVIVIFSYSFLAIGLFLLNFIDSAQQIDISSYLFGDILLVTTRDIILVSLVSVFILYWLWYRWRALLLSSINEDLAIIEGCNTRRLELELMFSVAIIISLSLKIVGVLLVAALLIIPSAAARNISKTSTSMVINAIIIGILSIVIGLFLSYFTDSPSGPSIIIFSIIMFILSLLCKRFFFAKLSV